MIKCIIFDMDGLLADTEELHFESYKKALSEYGVKLALEDYIDNWTNNGNGISEYIKDNKLNISVSAVKKSKTQHFLKMAKRDVKLFKGVLDFLNYLKNLNFKTAIASSASVIEIKSILETTKTTDYFSVIVGKEDVKKVKPFPDLFLEAANRANVFPNECLVLEDAEKGVKAAKKAGMICVAIPNIHTEGKIKTIADLTLSSLENIDFNKLINFQPSEVIYENNDSRFTS